MKLEISASYTAIIFSIYAVAVILWSPIVSKLLVLFDGSKVIPSGMLLLGLVYIMYGFID